MLSSLGIYGDQSTGTYTGVPAINLPIYTVSYRDIKVPISLSYHAAGIKVEQEASWVGLGWSLNAGGAITRTVRGLDDLTPISTKQGFPFISDMPGECSVRSEPNLHINYLQGNCNGSIDSEPDLFYFNIGGASGKFILEQNQSSRYQNELSGTMMAKSKMKVKYKWQGTDKHLGTWTITDENGTIYTFDTREFTFSATETKNTFENAELTLKQRLNDNAENSVVSALRSTSGWYLSKIESAIGGLVSFVYDVNQYATQSQWAYGMKRTEPSTFEIQPAIIPSGLSGKCSSELPAEFNRSISYTVSGSIHKEVYLKEIKFGDGSVKFTTSDRLDMIKTTLSGYTATANPQKLQAISVSHSQSSNSLSYNFDYDYFNPLGNTAEKRLKLLKFSQANLSHRFEYDPQALPAKTSFDQDCWGFYNAPLVSNTSPLPLTTFQMVVNGAIGVASLKNLSNPTVLTTDPANKLPNEVAMKAGILTKIIYPTGGSTTYTYEAHRFNTEKMPQTIGQGDELVTTLGLSTNPYNQAAPVRKKCYVTQPTAVTYTATIRCIDTNPIADCENAILPSDLEKLAACLLSVNPSNCGADSLKTVVSNTDVFYNDWKNCRTGQGPNCYKQNSTIGSDQTRGFKFIADNIVLNPGINYEMLINQGVALPSNLATKFAIDINLQVTRVNPPNSYIFANEADVAIQTFKISTNPFTTGTLSQTFTITEPTYIRFDGRATCLANLPGGGNTNNITDCEAAITAANEDKPMFGIYQTNVSPISPRMVYFFKDWKVARSNTQTDRNFLVELPNLLLQPGTYSIQINNGNALPLVLQKFDIYAAVSFANTPCKLSRNSSCGEKIGGGLRIKSISQDALNGSAQVRNFRYLNADGSSSGKLMSKVIYYGYYQYSIRPMLVGNNCKFVKVGVYTVESAPTIPLGTSAQGSIVGYDRVLTIDGASVADNAQNGVLGASILEFNNQSDVLDYEAFLPNSPNTNYGNSNGLLTKTTLINQLGKKVSEQNNTYSLKQRSAITGMKFQSFDGCSIVSIGSNQLTIEGTDVIVSKRYVDFKKVGDLLLGSYQSTITTIVNTIQQVGPSTPTVSVNFRTLEMIGKKFYYTYSDFWALDVETSRNYDMNDDTKFVEKTVNYNYSLADFKLKKTSTISSAGKTLETQYFHTSDYSPTIPAISQLVTKNMYDKLLGERQLVNGNIISAKATEYNQQGLATNVHVLETAIPIAPSPSNTLTFPLTSIVPTDLKKECRFCMTQTTIWLKCKTLATMLFKTKPLIYGAIKVCFLSLKFKMLVMPHWVRVFY